MAASHGNCVANRASPKAGFVAVLCTHLHQQTHKQTKPKKKEENNLVFNVLFISHNAAQLDNQGIEKWVKLGQMPIVDKG